MTESTIDTWLKAFLDARSATPDLDFDSWAGTATEVSNNADLRASLKHRLASKMEQLKPTALVPSSEAAPAETHFLNEAAAPPIPTEDGAPRPGQRIGPFVLKNRVGAVGMGQVWEAEDTELRRRVAPPLRSVRGCPEAHGEC